MNEKKKKTIRKILIIFIVILAVLAGGVLFVLTHTQIIVGTIQKLSANTVNTVNTAIVYEPLGEPMEDLKDNGQYVITEIKYSENYPNSYLDITYPNKDRDASNPTLIYFHGGGFFGGSKSVGDACLLFCEFIGCVGRQRRRDRGRNHAEGCCPGRCGSDRRDLPGVEEVAE